MSPSLYLVLFLNGLAFASLLSLIALGLNLVFGVLRVLNFAHGALYMLGAYMALQVLLSFDNFWLALPVASALVGALALAIEYSLLRPMYGREMSYQLLLTFGLLLVMTDVTKMVWGAGFRSVSAPPELSWSVSILGIAYPAYHIFIILAGGLSIIALHLFLSSTRFGKRVRAASMDREIAGAIGINVPRFYTAVFALGAFLAGMGGVLASPVRSLSTAMGTDILVESFAVVVIGGLGSFPGSLLGSFLIGEFEAFGVAFIPQFELAFIYIVMAAVLILRPRGLISG